MKLNKDRFYIRGTACLSLFNTATGVLFNRVLVKHIDEITKKTIKWCIRKATDFPSMPTLAEAFKLWDGQTTWGHIAIITDQTTTPPNIYYRAMTCGIARDDDNSYSEVEHYNPAMAIWLSHRIHKHKVSQLKAVETKKD